MVLVLYDTEIKGWCVGEPIESAEAHIRNGYPHLLEGWQKGTVTAEVIDIVMNERFRADLYEVKNGVVVRKLDL